MFFKGTSWRNVRYAFAIFVIFWTVFVFTILTGLGSERSFLKKGKKAKGDKVSRTKAKQVQASVFIPSEYVANSSQREENFGYLIQPDYSSACEITGGARHANLSDPENQSLPRWRPPLLNVVLVHSGANHFQHRDVIRKTWGSLGRRLSKIVFLLGDPQNQTVQAKLEEESKTFGDILQDEHYESYRNITMKAVMGMKWVTRHCPRAIYVTKCDDDMYLNMKALMHTFLSREIPKRGFLLCKPVKHSPVVRYGKYGVPKSLYAGTEWPEFCFGGCWIATNDVIQEFYRASLRTKQIYLDDVYVTGILRTKIQLKITRLAARMFCHGRGSPERVLEMWNGRNQTDPKLRVDECFH